MEQSELIYLPIGKIKDLNSKRERIEIHDLVDSIGSVGLKTPLVVRKIGSDWVLESGSRRLGALKELRRRGVVPPGLEFEKIPCYVSGLDDTDPDLVRLITNVQRELNPSEIGKVAIEVLTSQNPHTTIGFFSKAIGIPVEKVELMIDLANAPDCVRHKVNSGEMSLSAFSRIRSAPKEFQKEIASEAGNVTVEKTKRLLRQEKAKANGASLIVSDEQTTVQVLNDILNKLSRIVNDNRLGPREKHIINQIKQTIGEHDDNN